MKPVIFLGDALDVIRAFPDGARQATGFQLERVQRGLLPHDWKPMPTVGSGVREIRIRGSSGAYRVIFTAVMAEAIYVLHAFQKKSEKTSKADLDLAAKRWREIA